MDGFYRADSFPTHRIGDLRYRSGRVFPFGATIRDNGVNFSVYSKDATGCTLVLYHHGQAEPFAEIPFPESFRIGDVYTMLVYGLNIETTEYGYRFDGPWDPEKGLRFDRNRVVLDPYAKSVSGRSVLSTGFIFSGRPVLFSGSANTSPSAAVTTGTRRRSTPHLLQKTTLI